MFGKKLAFFIISIIIGIALMIVIAVSWYNYGYSEGHDDGLMTERYSIIDGGSKEIYMPDRNGEYHHVIISVED